MMNIDEEIRLAQEEKEINKKVNALLEGINFTNNDAAALLELKYSKNIEVLRNYPYFEKLRECLSNKELNTDTVKELWTTVTESLKDLESTDCNVLKESYTQLATIYTKLEEGFRFFQKKLSL